MENLPPRSRHSLRSSVWARQASTTSAPGVGFQRALKKGPRVWLRSIHRGFRNLNSKSSKPQTPKPEAIPKPSNPKPPPHPLEPFKPSPTALSKHCREHFCPLAALGPDFEDGLRAQICDLNFRVPFWGPPISKGILLSEGFSNVNPPVWS